MSKYHKKPIWEPVKMIKRPNCIISSDLGYLKPFTPSYEKDPINMYYLMGMEYQRMWNRERDTWEEELFPIIPATKRLVIKSVKRLRVNKKPKHIEPPQKPTTETFTMKKFQNIGSKVKTTRTGKNLSDVHEVRKEADSEAKSACSSRCSCKAPEAAEGQDDRGGPGGDAHSEASRPSSPAKACPQDTPCPEKQTLPRRN